MFTCKRLEKVDHKFRSSMRWKRRRIEGRGRERDIARGYISGSGTAEMTQGLKVNAVLTEEPSSAPHFHGGQLTVTCN